MGWTCSEPLSMGLAGVRCGACRMHVTLCSTSALLRLGTQSRPQVVQSVSFSSSLTPQRGKTCRFTLPKRSPYIYTAHALIVGKTITEHAIARVCSALTYSALQCPGVMPGFTGEWHTGPLSGLCLQG